MADVKITALPAAAGANLTDLLVKVNDPSGVPVTQKLTITQLKSLLQPYTVYRALLNQAGGAVAPTPTVLENTIGAIVWSYTAAGVYSATLLGAFPAGKTYVMMGNSMNGSAGFGLASTGGILLAGRVSNNVVGINLYTDITIPALGDAGMADQAIDILVYP